MRKKKRKLVSFVDRKQREKRYDKTKRPSSRAMSFKNGEQRFLAKEILQRYIDDFTKRYNGKDCGIEMFNATIHLDETENNGIVHEHINIVFHSNDNKRGMQHKVSMNKALNQLGFRGNEKLFP